MKNMTIDYVLRAYEIIKKEIAKYNVFDIDERYFQLRRELQICEKYLRETEPELAKYI